jgi:predicted metal-binding membrane protein
MMASPLDRRSMLLPMLGGLVALAWTVLWLWERSPYGRYLNHSELAHFDLAGDAATMSAQVLVYVAGWVLMTAAMMLPTTFPLLLVFRRMTMQRGDATRLIGLVIGGYLFVWLLFGIVAHAFDFGLHLAFDRSDWLQANAWVFGAGPLLAAGAFQFSSLKYRCLDKCRAPLSFVVQHWHGGGAATQAFALGAHHGAFCVGCCWALMLLMFAVGTGNVGWMLVLGALMAVEKNTAWGRQFSVPLGAVLLLWGAMIVLNHSLSWQGW